MLDLPVHVPLLMVLCCLAGVFALYRASGNSKTMLWICGIWMAFQAAVSLTGFYLASFSMPPRFLLIIGPPFLLILVLFNNRDGKRFLDRLDLTTLMWAHTIRVPLEFCFFWLHQHGYYPAEMTYDGRNFGYLAGLTAPFMIWLTLPANTPARYWGLMTWNFLCIGLMINSIRMGILSSPHFAAAYGYEVPNRALGYFPYVWQPSLLVPLFFLGHVVGIRRLIKQKY